MNATAQSIQFSVIPMAHGLQNNVSVKPFAQHDLISNSAFSGPLKNCSGIFSADIGAIDPFSTLIFRKTLELIYGPGKTVQLGIWDGGS
ncbi:MAG: hypothetical protein QW812_05875 [Thermoplasmataceae archaeon]